MGKDLRTWPEPAPNWPEAKQTWAWRWSFHVYFFTALYCLVIVRGLFMLLTKGKVFLRSKNHRLVMNCLLLFFGILRLVFFTWDPYGSSPTRTKAEMVASIITFGIGTACLTSSFSFLLLIVLESTRISLAPSKLQSRSFLTGVCAVNVLYIITSDLIVAHFHSAKVMILICQIAFALWGILVAFGYALAALRLWRNLRASRQASQFDRDLATEGKKFVRLIKLLCLASICGAVLFSTIVFSAVGETSVYGESEFVNIWPWLAIQSLLRGCEILMCLLIFIIALRSNTSSSTNNNNNTVDTMNIKSTQSEETREPPF